MLTDINDAIDHLRFLAKRFSLTNAGYVVTLLLLEIGIPTNYDGFEYLVKAILIYYDDLTQVFEKGLYPSVTEACGRGAEPDEIGAITKAISGAIETAWNFNCHERDIYFPPDRFPGKPSNTVFISRMARILQVWEGCCKQIECERETKRRLLLESRN